MPEYHVGCGISGIYAGTVNKKGDMWKNKSCVTQEAIQSVIAYMYFEIPKGKNAYALATRMRSGDYVRLTIEKSETCPEWAKEKFKEDNLNKTIKEEN